MHGQFRIIYFSISIIFFIGHTDAYGSAIQTIGKLGFQQIDRSRFKHPSGVSLRNAYPGELPPQVVGHFTFLQINPGRTKVLNPEWVTNKNILMIYKNMSEIAKHDIEPIIVIDMNREDDEIAMTLAHEGIHFADSQIGAGKLETAINIAGAKLNPRWTALALAYDLYTEFRAYGLQGDAGATAAFDGVADFLKNPNSVNNHFDALVENTTAFTDQLYGAVSHSYIDPATHAPAVLSPAIKSQAGRNLAIFMKKYGLRTRIPIPFPPK